MNDQNQIAANSWGDAFGAWASSLRHTQRDTLIWAIGLTGAYDGRVWSTNNIIPSRAYMKLKDFQGDINGTITMLEAIEIDGGSICGKTSVPAGSSFAVHAKSVPTPPPGTLVPPWYDHKFQVNGSTTRNVSKGLFSGQAVIFFSGTLWPSVNLPFGPQQSYLNGSILIDPPSPCNSMSLSVSFGRRDFNLEQQYRRPSLDHSITNVSGENWGSTPAMFDDVLTMGRPLTHSMERGREPLRF